MASNGSNNDYIFDVNIKSSARTISSAVKSDDKYDSSQDMNFEKNETTRNLDNITCGAGHMSRSLKNVAASSLSGDTRNSCSDGKGNSNEAVVDGSSNMESQQSLGVPKIHSRSSSKATSSTVDAEADLAAGILGIRNRSPHRSKCDNETTCIAIDDDSVTTEEPGYDTGSSKQGFVYTTRKLGSDVMYMCFDSTHDDKLEHEMAETMEILPSDVGNTDKHTLELGQMGLESNCEPEPEALPKHEMENNIFQKFIQDFGIIENDKSITVNKKTSTPTPKPKRKQSYTNAVRKHVCEECGAAFTKKYYLEKHYLVHTGERPFTCTICNSSFGLKGTLQRHLLIHNSEKGFICDICNKAFTYLHILKHHQLVHTDEKPFSCEMCGAEFKEKCHLDRHIFRHTGEKPFHCEICGMRFVEKYQKSRHMIQHSGKKPFKCETCGSEFARKTGLQNHTLAHTGERPFKCEHCDMTYRRKDDLSKHQYKHTGVKPYFCGICNSSFTRKRHLEMHIQTQHMCSSDRPMKSCPKKPHLMKSVKTSINVPNSTNAEKNCQLSPSQENIVSTILPIVPTDTIKKLEDETKETKAT